MTEETRECKKCGGNNSSASNYCSNCAAPLNPNADLSVINHKQTDLSSSQNTIKPNPYIGFIISLILPGFAHIAMGQLFKGIVLACIGFGTAFFTFFIVYILSGIFSAIDVFILTKKMNSGIRIRKWEFFFQKSDPDPCLCSQCNAVAKEVWKFCSQCGAVLRNKKYIHLIPGALSKFNVFCPGVIHMYMGQELKGLMWLIIAIIGGFFSFGILYPIIGIFSAYDLWIITDRLNRDIPVKKWDFFFSKNKPLVCSNNKCQVPIREDWNFCPSCKRNLAKDKNGLQFIRKINGG